MPPPTRASSGSGELLAGAGVDLIGFDTGVAQDVDTYAANATLKAEAASRETGPPALGGALGLHSARIAAIQPEREGLLFDQLAGSRRWD